LCRQSLQVCALEARTLRTLVGETTYRKSMPSPWDLSDDMSLHPVHLTLCGHRSQARQRSRRSRRFAGVGREHTSARDGQDALRASVTSARGLEMVETVLTFCGRRRQARERSRWSRRLAGVGRMHTSARDGLDTLRATAASARALETVLTLCGRQPQASARDGLDALRASAASARALETVKTPCGRRAHARERLRRS
jgi:hypothetical protein